MVAISEINEANEVGKNSFCPSKISEFRSIVQQLAKWKPSSIGWRCYQFFDTLLYCLSWPFLLVSWAGFLGVCLIDCGVIQLPNFVNFVGMCLKFTYFGSAAFVVAILFQVMVPFAFWHAFVDYHIMIAKHSEWREILTIV